MSEVAPSTVSTKFWQPAEFPTLLERYKILGIIGQGGMGTVFKGYHTNLKRFVAIKALRLDRNKDPELVHRFVREMAAIGQMDHPNVVRASDGGEKNGVLHLVMEFLTGMDFARLVAARGRLEAADACELTRQAALGLEYIHQTLIHRDIKPSNLMLTTAGQVKILDLGLARLHEAETGGGEHTPQGCVLGTYDYMAPEQAEPGTPIDGRADLYSLGCTLFKLLTGRAPFSGPEYDSLARKLYGHRHVPLTAVKAFQEIPEEVRTVVLRMTAKEPAERYGSAREVARALAPLAAGSQLLQLLGGIQPPVETAVQPLPQPLPEELSLLTDPPLETPVNTDRAPATRTWRRFRRRHVLLGTAILTCTLAAAAWFLAPVLFNRVGDGDPGVQGQPAPAGVAPGDPTAEAQTANAAGSTVRSLDPLETDSWHPLLDQAPIPVGLVDPGPRKWRWDKRQELLEVKWHDGLLCRLGTTSQKRFTLMAGIAQVPWTGNVGVFWGYHEDPAAMKTTTPGQEFAGFQMVIINHRTGAKGRDHYSVQRGKGRLWYDVNGVIRFNCSYLEKHDLPGLAAGEKILVITIDHNRLVRALLESVELTALCSAAVNKAFSAEPSGGALGLLTLSHEATFDNVRFMAHANK